MNFRQVTAGIASLVVLGSASIIGAGYASAAPSGTPSGATTTVFTNCPSDGPLAPGDFDGPLTVSVTQVDTVDFPTPTGTVSFDVTSGPDHQGALGDGTLSGGTASSDSIDFDEAGEYTITAHYNGDVHSQPSDADDCVVDVASGNTLTVSSSSPNDPVTTNPTSVLGDPVTFTITLTIAQAQDRRGRARPALEPTCSSNFVRPSEGPPPGPCVDLDVENADANGEFNELIPLTFEGVDGQGDSLYTASREFDDLPLGSHLVQADYSPPAPNGRQRAKQEDLTDSFTQDVVNGGTGPKKRPSKTVLTSSANPSGSGAPVTFTATVTPADGGGGTPTGTVVFAADGTNHPETLAAGVATFEDDTLTDGAHAVTATYTGDSTFSSSADQLLQMVGSGGTGPGGLSGLLFTEPGTSALGLITVAGASQDLPLRAGSGPASLAIGSDDRIWVVEAGKDAVAAVDSTGHETDYPLSTDAFPTSIVAGSDGRLWVAEPGLHRIAAITTSGTITNYPLGRHAEPFVLAAGHHGRVWFTEPDRARIGRIRANGHHTSFPVRAGSKPLGISAGPDGAMWFTEANKRRIGRITTAGVATDVKVAKHSKPSAIVTGPDGALWFTEPGLGRIGRITVGGAVTSFAARAGGKPSAIVVGPDQRLWFTEPGSHRIGAMTQAGAFTDYTVAAGSNPSAIISLS